MLINFNWTHIHSLHTHPRCFGKSFLSGYMDRPKGERNGTEFRRNKECKMERGKVQKTDESVGLTTDSAGGSGGFLVFSLSQELAVL